MPRSLIPRVQVGDILKGTRNLRGYLQTAATLNFLTAYSRDLSKAQLQKAKKTLYKPSKNERFLVTVNSTRTFGVHSLDSDILLLFVNPIEQPAQHNRFPLTPSSMRQTMSPTIFSKWFVRTPRKKTDTRKWPSYAFFMWVALHLNLHAIPRDSAPKVRVPDGPQGPFGYYKQYMGQWSREELITVFQQWVATGLTRKPDVGNLGYGSMGPLLKDTQLMREEIDRLCNNPRTMNLVKALGFPGSAFK